MRKSKFAIIGAVLTALLSTLCCLPAFLFLFFGFSSGFLSYFTSLEYTRVPLALISVISFLIYLYSIKNSSSSCDINKKTRGKRYIFAIVFFLILLGLIFYPEIIPLFME